ncbi:MAG: class II aldolase/adducin family protein [Lentimicrobiaceae bacterium]|nr:class II aldolase/adducin family protein [Lentimicrobiaceae bacterium]
MDEFIYWARKAAAYNLVKCSSGNLSQRIDDQQMLVSGTGSWLESLSAEQVAVVDSLTGESLNNVQPTGELPLHLALTRMQRPGINAVLHFQSEAATTLCCADFVPDYNVIIEIPLYVGEVVTLPYLQPGSEALADAVSGLPPHIRMVQMSNHGQIAMGSSLKEVMQKAVFFELACKVIVNSNKGIKRLNHEQIEGLKAYAKSRN